MNVIEFSCPQCGQPIELPEADAGSTRPCPACEEWVSVPSREEAEVGEAPPSPPPERDVVVRKAPASPTAPPGPLPTDGSAPTEHPVDPSRRPSALSGGWSCLITGLLLMYFLPPAHLVYLPLFAAAFILGIVALAQGKAIGGQLVLILSLLAPVMLGVHVLGMKLPDWAPEWVRIPGFTEVRSAPEEGDGSTETNQVEVVETQPVPSAWTPSTAVSEEPGAEADWFGMEEDEAMEEAPATDWGNTPIREETDWRERYQYWFEQYSGRFKAPVAGARVSLELRSGGVAEGTLLHVGLDRITLQIPNGTVSYEQERLAEATRRNYFREDFARYHAQRRVQAERDGPTPSPSPPQRSPPPAAPPVQPTRGFGDFL